MSMDKVLTLAEKKGAEYAEVLEQVSSSTIVEAVNKEIRQISAGENKLYAVRVVFEGRLGAAYSYNNDYAKLLNSAIANAKANDNIIDFSYAKPVKKKIVTKFKVNPLDVDIITKKEFVQGLDDKEGFNNIPNLRLTYNDIVQEHKFMNTESSEILWKDCATSLAIVPIAKRNNELQNYVKIVRDKGGYEVVKNAAKDVKEAMRKAEQMLDAKLAKGGKFKVIADNHLTGVFAHEAVGHACEADLVMNNVSILTGKTGEKIANEQLSISDDGNLKTWGWTPFDSEGVKATKTKLIQNGVLNSFMHSRTTAKKFNQKLTGNGRAQSVMNRVIPRMTTTYVEKGDSSFEEMLAEVKKGYYLKDSLGGQVDTGGGSFLFNAKEGYWVENGEIKHMVKGVSLVGNIMKTMFNIKLIGNDMKYGSGFCGKSGQYVPVSDGGPHMLIENATVGGAK
ncbi:TldD/PmbA family protein [Candidatus Woesearchaeota archaeon]|nr:MAG: TldD/PmbA family protein [Candidatus Woesearchaeota archaeon]